MKELTVNEIEQVNGGAFSPGALAASMGAGAVTGALTGSLAVGVGAGPGAVGGAIMGGIGYLAYEFLMSVQ
ncbi:hypothetical protein ACN0IJ_17540 [Shewanella indica]|jgi:hypothetical protein|uniref:hypothetical protein n=1 Tax=Shewanella indica TaxID=768528 RepID=UPI003D36DCE1